MHILQIHIAGDADKDELSELILSMDEEERALSLFPLPETKEAIDAFFLSHGQSAPIFIAKKGKIVGFSFVGPLLPGKAFRASCQIQVYVKKAARGQGIGRALLHNAVLECQSLFYHVAISLVNAADLETVALFTQAGFSGEALLPQMILYEGKYSGVYCMTKLLG